MIVARQKKQENIAEYVLYMWNIEDSIRALNLEQAKVEEHLVARYEVDDSVRAEITEWYRNIISEMKSRGLQDKGHLEEVEEVINELALLHHTLLNITQDFEYKKLLEKANESLETIQQKGGTKIQNPVEAALTGLYGVLVLKMGGKQVSENTLESINILSELLAYLSNKYLDMKRGALV